MHRRLARRDLLTTTGAAVAVTLAGCTGEGLSSGDAQLPPATFRMDVVDDAELPPKVLYTVGIEGPARRAELMAEIVDGGTTVNRTRPPLPEDRHIYYDDTVYQLSYEIIEQTPATSYQIRVDIVQGTVTEAETIAFSDLPAVDRKKFAAHGWDDGGTFGFGTSLLYTHAERNKSALVPDSEYAYIGWGDGSEAAWFVDDSSETTLYTYEYSAAQYSTATEYGRRMREQLSFELSGLSDAESAIIQTAIDEKRYTVARDETPSPAFRSLADRFRDQEQAHDLAADGEGDLSGPYLVQYGGAVYWTVLDINTER